MAVSQERVQAQVEKIVAYYKSTVSNLPKPAHCDKSEDELIEMIAEGTITPALFKEIKQYKETMEEDSSDEFVAMIEELVDIFQPGKREVSMSQKDKDNKEICEALGVEFAKSYAAPAIAHIIGQHTKPQTFRAQYKNHMVAPFLEFFKGDKAKAKKALEAEIEKIKKKNEASRKK